MRRKRFFFFSAKKVGGRGKGKGRGSLREWEWKKGKKKGKVKLEVKLWQKRKISQTPQPGIERDVESVGSHVDTCSAFGA